MFWNLIYYFSESHINPELIVPYADKALVTHFVGMMSVNSKQTILENIRRFGLKYLDVMIQMKKK